MVLSDDWCLFFERDPDTNLEIQQRAVCRFFAGKFMQEPSSKQMPSFSRSWAFRKRSDDSIICTSRLLVKRWLIQFDENVSDFYKTTDEKLGIIHILRHIF